MSNVIGTCLGHYFGTTVPKCYRPIYGWPMLDAVMKKTILLVSLRAFKFKHKRIFFIIEVPFDLSSHVHNVGYVYYGVLLTRLCAPQRNIEVNLNLKLC